MTDRTSLLIPYTIPEDSYTHKTSILAPFQLPQFVRDDPAYANFVLFLKAYYEWMEQEGQVTFDSKGLPQYYDVDTTLDKFIDYFRNDFLAFFPEGSLVDERKLIKIARQLYQAKGTPASFEFLFRVLYDSDVNLFNTKDYIFKASDGKWVATKSLKLETTDFSWLGSKNYKIFGEDSKAYATVEDVFINIENVSIVLSSIQGNFLAGEYIRVVDVHGHDHLVNGVLPRARIIGLLREVQVDKKNRGSGYNVGDPVVFYGGLNDEVENPVGAEAYISAVTSASIKGVTTLYSGHGYRKGAFTEINLISPSGANAKSVATTFTKIPYYIFLVPDDTIGPKANIYLGNTTFSTGPDPIGNSIYYFANLTNANANTTLAEALSFPILKTFGIEQVDIITTGTGYDGTTIANAVAFYSTDQDAKTPLQNLGILPPPIIVDGGKNYNVGDTLVFSGGTGYGAWANVTAVSTQTGAITEVTYVPDPAGVQKYPLGGMGYQILLPTISVSSPTGFGANLQFVYQPPYISGLIGNNADFEVSESAYGQVLEITLTESGQNYVARPNVSLRIEDLLVNNVEVQVIKGDILYQGDYNTPNYQSFIDTTSTYTGNTIVFRTYNYNGLMNANTTFSLARGANTISSNITIAQITDSTYTNGRKIYGNGIAKANAIFTNGIEIGLGVYENEDGMPSSYSIFEDDVYNEYTYLLQVEAALTKYKNAVFNFLHPSGLNYNTYNITKNEAAFNYTANSESLSVTQLQYLLNTDDYVADISPLYANTIIFTNLSNVAVSSVVNTNNYITVYPNKGAAFYSKVASATANTITFEDDWITTVPNVAIGTVTSGSAIINITGLTDAWTIATGNTITYFSDFMHNYDSVSFDGVTFKQIVSVDQPIEINNSILPPATIRVNTSYASAQTGYLIFRQNVMSSNVWSSYINPITN
jgi:hypothetical protein